MLTIVCDRASLGSAGEGHLWGPPGAARTRALPRRTHKAAGRGVAVPGGRRGLPGPRRRSVQPLRRCLSTPPATLGLSLSGWSQERAQGAAPREAGARRGSVGQERTSGPRRLACCRPGGLTPCRGGDKRSERPSPATPGSGPGARPGSPPPMGGARPRSSQS